MLAEVEFVMISKALKALEKNKSLLTEYIANDASKLFFQLAGQYNLDLEVFTS